MSREGAYLVLKQKDARELLNLDGDQAIRSFVDGLRNSKAYIQEDLVLECQSDWDPIHRALTDGTLDYDGGEFPLNHCVLGGKRLYQGSDFEAIFIRTDIVPFVAEAIHKMKRAEFRDRYFAIDAEDYGRAPSEEELDRVWPLFRQIVALFEFAADELAPMLFTAERQ